MTSEREAGLNHDAGTQGWTATGIVVFGEAIQLRFADRQARSFMALPRKDHEAFHHNDLYIEVSNFAAELMEQAPGRMVGGSVPLRASTKAIRTSQGPFCLRGFWVASGTQTTPSCHVLIVIRDDVVNHAGVQAEG